MRNVKYWVQYFVNLKMTLICGIDEAGRGPVIGSMVMAGVLIDKKDSPKLKALGVKDSKLLTKEQREALFDKIVKTVKQYKIIIVPPKEIDEALESEELNLNWLEAHKSADIINYLKPDKAILDCPSINIEKYQSYVENLLKNKVKLIVEHKADVNYIESGAASILAKVTRDKEMEKIQKKYGNTGPGYPSNEITQNFLKENWNKYPEIFRQTWSSYKKHKEAKNQSRLGDFQNFY
ncbi:MAG: ribonuclease HII [Nanoarchaeota archaeon]|nr:ribonuclease HII [Nanoarchaeota archaeon]